MELKQAFKNQRNVNQKESLYFTYHKSLQHNICKGVGKWEVSKGCCCCSLGETTQAQGTKLKRCRGTILKIKSPSLPCALDTQFLSLQPVTCKSFLGVIEKIH